MVRAAVVGMPVSHSLSPVIFGFLSRRLKKPLSYQKLPLSVQELARYARAQRDKPEFVGWNITIPHKESMAKLVDRSSNEATLIGAVNAVRFRRRRIEGFNTDVYGIQKTLEGEHFQARGKTVVLFGAGGAALAVGYAIGKSGAKELWIVNREIKRGRRVCRRLGMQFPKTRFVATGLGESELWPQAALYVNATPLGMKGFPKRSLLPGNTPRGALAFDLVYRPEKTLFLDTAKKRGLRTVGGLDMLVWQALRTWELWFGKIEDPVQTHLMLKKYLRKTPKERLQ